MTEKGLRIESWESMNGRTFAVCDHHAILSMHKSEEEAQAALEAVKRAVEEMWASFSPDDKKTGAIAPESEPPLK